MNPRSIVSICLLVLMVAGCGRRAIPAPATPTPERTVSESPLAPPLTPTPAPTEQTSPLPDPDTSPLQPPVSKTEDVVAAAQAYLAEELSVDLDRIEAVSVEPVEWPDTSLGCPEPGEAYLQVITPGYRIILEADEKRYRVHTDQDGEAIRICEPQLEKGPAAAVAYLAQALDISEEEIEVMSIERYEWPDASLGCPEPGKSYIQVVTPGYRVILRARGELYEVRTDLEGGITVLCDRTD